MSNVIPFKFEAREVRTLLIDDQPWFVASDVARALEYRDAGDLTRNLDDDEADTHIMRTSSANGVEQTREMLIINESGLYSAILRSRKAEAKRFKKWVTAEVLPSIRKTGSYHVAANGEFVQGAMINRRCRGVAKHHPIQARPWRLGRLETLTKLFGKAPEWRQVA